MDRVSLFFSFLSACFSNLLLVTGFLVVMSFELGSNFAFHAMTETYTREAEAQALAVSLWPAPVLHTTLDHRDCQAQKTGFYFFYI